MWNPLSWVMMIAALVAIAPFQAEGMEPNWPNFVGILLLLFIHSAIGLYQERSAGDAFEVLMDSLTFKVKARRDGIWSEVESSDLVPGDMVSFRTGDIIPADCRLTDASNVTMDQTTLTGEYVPVSKSKGDQCFSGSICKHGVAEGVVTSTGADTIFERAAALVGREEEHATSRLQKIMAQTAFFCLVITGLFVLLEVCVLYGGFHYSCLRGLKNIIVLLIGGIPIAMPIVFSVTLVVGAQQLAKHKAIVTRLTAIEDLAGVNVLCSEKSGIITINKLTVDRTTVKTYGSYSVEDVILRSAYASRTENQDVIDACIVQSLSNPSQARAGITVLDFRPFNPVDGRTEITYREESTGRMRRVTKGMTGIIIQLCTRNKTEELEDALEADVEELAGRGLRLLGVACEEVEGDDCEAEGNGFEFIGLLTFFDPPRVDSKQAVEDSRALGVDVMMVTDDQLSIAKEAGRRTGLGDHMYAANVLRTGNPLISSTCRDIDKVILGADGLAGAFPEHKYEIVKRLQALGHLCATTGDRSDDAPALFRAIVGIAVDAATDEARGAADIVLTDHGLATM